MAKLKYLSAFSLIFLLVGCKEEATIKKPVYSPYSQTITHEQLLQDYSWYVNTNPVLGATNKSEVPSYVSETNVATEASATKTISGDSKEMVLYDTKSSTNMEVKGYYDQEKNIFEYYAEKNDVANNKYYNNEQTNESVTRSTRSFQLEEDKKKVVNIFNIQTKSLTALEDNEKTIAYLGSSIVSKSAFISSSFFPSQVAWDFFTEEVRDRYTFYRDGDVLTISYTFELDFEGKELINDVEMVTLRRNQQTQCLLQFFFTPEEFSYREYRTSVSKTETFDIRDTYIVKETTETSVIASIESIIRLNSNLSLTSENPSNYHEGGDVLTSLYYPTY